MNRQEDHGCAIGMRRKTSGTPHGQPLHKMQHKSVSNLVVDRSLLVGRATSNTAARPSKQPECFSYLFSAPNALKIQLDKLSFPAVCSAASVILLLSQQAIAADWKLTPSLDLEETYSDNIRLAPRGGEKSDWVTQVNPGISLTGTGPHLKAHVTYRMQNIFYANDSSQRKTNHQLSAGATAELLDEFLFLDGNASISQQNISLLGPLTTDNLNVTGNRADVITYSISPYLRHHFDSLASTELRYTHNSVGTSSSGLSSSKADSILFSLNSGSAFRTLGWGLRYNGQRTDSRNDATTTSQAITGNLRYMVSSKFSLTATAGYEKNDYLSIGEKPEGHFWSAGFAWDPQDRTSIAASTGRRFFGKTHQISASHRTRNSVWSLGYNEDITSSRDQFLIPATIDTSAYLNNLFAASIPDPVLRQQYVDYLISSNGLPASLSDPINYFTNQFFLQKRLQASVALNGAKSTVLFTIFNSSRKSQTSIVVDSILQGTNSLTLVDNTKQLGGSALWSWRISPRTSAHISAAYTRNSLSSRTDYDKAIRLGLARQFRPKLSGAIEFRRLMHDSSLSSSDYIENAATASLIMTF